MLALYPVPCHSFTEAMNEPRPLPPENYELNFLETCGLPQLIVADPVGSANTFVSSTNSSTDKTFDNKKVKVRPQR